MCVREWMCRVYADVYVSTHASVNTLYLYQGMLFKKVLHSSVCVMPYHVYIAMCISMKQETEGK